MIEHDRSDDTAVAEVLAIERRLQAAQRPTDVGALKPSSTRGSS